MKWHIFPLIVFTGITLTQCKKIEINSAWRSGEIIIDGNTTEWASGFTQISNSSKCAVGIKNDSTNLYICFTSFDLDINRLIENFGLTLNFIGSKKNNSAVMGIHYPLGMYNCSGYLGVDRKQMKDPQYRKEMLEQMLQRVELIGPTKNDSKPMGINVAESFGIQVRFSQRADGIVCELKIPLKNGSPLVDNFDLRSEPVVKVMLETVLPDEKTKGTHAPGNGGSNDDGLNSFLEGGQSPNQAGGMGMEPFRSTIFVKLSSGSQVQK